MEIVTSRFMSGCTRFNAYQALGRTNTLPSIIAPAHSATTAAGIDSPAWS